MRFFHRSEPGQMVPVWFGLVCRDWARRESVSAPIPLNLPIRAAYLLWLWVRAPFLDNLRENVTEKGRWCCLCGRSIPSRDAAWRGMTRREACMRCVNEIVRCNVTVIASTPAPKEPGHE